jgi:excisionase family DNA binding protein
MMTPYTRAYSVKEVAKMWGVSAQHVRRLIQKGELAAFTAGSHILRVSEQSLGEFLCRHQEPVTDFKRLSTPSKNSEADGPSSTLATQTARKSDTVSPLEPEIAERLRRRRLKYGRISDARRAHA